MTSELIKSLDWDSDFFGVRIARILPNSIDKDQMQTVESWCDDNNIDCIYFLADPDNLPSVKLAQDHGFKAMDTRTTLSIQLTNITPPTPDPSSTIRQSLDSDIPHLMTIAAESHTDSRFYVDSNFSKERCDSLYKTWISKSCHGFADVVLAASFDGSPAGYITCHIRDAQNGEIGLVAVSKKIRNQGIGNDLINCALAWFIDNNMETVTVTTQGKNTQALSFYKKAGFTISSSEIWLHRWPKK